MSQPAFEGMPEPLYPAAPARLTTYLDCPRRYRMTYLDRPTPAGGPWGHLSVGAAVHTALARWWALPRERRTPESGGALLVGAWLGDGFKDRAQLDAARERSRLQVEHYLAHVDPDDEPLAVERTLTLRTPRASLWGRVDRIDDRPGQGIVVVDYKTGRSVPTVDTVRSSLALAVYASAAARTLRRPCTRVELHHLPSGQVVAWDHTEESLATHLDRADALAAELSGLDGRFRAGLPVEEADRAFPPRVASRCGWCSVRAACPAGREVPPQQRWAGVPTG
ncbi:MAG: PD-(D/E)XK nuclease family protein [Nocardioidaceae bacterium]